MSTEITYLFFEVTRGSPVWEAAHKFLATRLQQEKARTACVTKYGANGSYSSKHSLLGLVFENGNAPDNWRRVQGAHNVWTPRGSSKEAKATRQEFHNLPLHDFSNFQELLGCNGLYFMKGMSIHYMFFEFVGEALILRVPDIKVSRWKVPAGCTKLPESEVIRRKEQLQASLAPQPPRVLRFFMYGPVLQFQAKMDLQGELQKRCFWDVHAVCDKAEIAYNSEQERMRTVALQRVDAIRTCDLVIVFKSHRFSGGSVLGMGVMAGKPVVLISDEAPTSPMLTGVSVSHPLVHEFASPEDFLKSDLLENIKQETRS